MTNRSVKISYLRAVQLLSLILLSINNVSILTLQSFYESYDVTLLIVFSYTILTECCESITKIKHLTLCMFCRGGGPIINNFPHHFPGFAFISSYEK